MQPFRTEAPMSDRKGRGGPMTERCQFTDTCRGIGFFDWLCLLFLFGALMSSMGSQFEATRAVCTANSTVEAP